MLVTTPFLVSRYQLFDFGLILLDIDNNFLEWVFIDLAIPQRSVSELDHLDFRGHPLNFDDQPSWRFKEISSGLNLALGLSVEPPIRRLTSTDHSVK